ncbi:cytochrome c oxidase subunit 3 [Deminuibacter soli]|uniref:Heme-copper oxidase subunit III n=1 Tax=Deminuibacter soli TaxID=2291815 RepID=A0A3E1NS38_9BACT|nr:cytochrome c oxidase subunit 3 [Deminuibacter soli]RFM30654.1 heme-copper oxidase subunit III [Deminuibacter soli]
MENTVSTERKRIHPHKFTLWVAMGSIVMMFAGLTSAYIVKRNQSNWLEFGLPAVFWYSTAVIIISSVTMHLAVKAFKAKEMARYRKLITLTAGLGLLFAGLQFIGFSALHKNGVQLFGIGSNPSASFLGIITGLHVLHVLGGVVALIVSFARAFRVRTRSYAATPVEVVATYWHFVDILWIYLFIFFNWIG